MSFSGGQLISSARVRNPLVAVLSGPASVAGKAPNAPADKAAASTAAARTLRIRRTGRQCRSQQKSRAACACVQTALQGAGTLIVSIDGVNDATAKR